MQPTSQPPSPPSASSPSSAAQLPCPRCGAPPPSGGGRFCSSCGAALGEQNCGSCGAGLRAGARYCHRCGTAVGTAAPEARRAGGLPEGGTTRGIANALPWAVAGIALVALIALVAGQRFGAAGPGSLPSASLAAPANAPAPDISAMSPRERADRLFDRIMLLDSQGKQDSVMFFAQMGISAFQMLPELDLHARYDMGRIAEVAGIRSLAAAQADTILRQHDDHLLGLILAAAAARMAGNDEAARSYDLRLLAAEPPQRALGLVEYLQHQPDIDSALARARATR